MSDQRFRVLDGGLLNDKPEDSLSVADHHNLSFERSALEFSSAWITNTRLMGVVCMGIRWQIKSERISEFLQYFYFDCVSFGFDRYDDLIDPDEQEEIDLEESYIGGLGAEQEEISEKEAAHLLRYYTEFNRKHDIEMPPGMERYSFLIHDKSKLSENAVKILFRKSCQQIRSRVEAANYYLMRCTDKDWEAVDFLSDNTFSDQLSGIGSAGVYCNSVIDDEEDEDLVHCRSIISTSDDEEKFYLLISSIRFTPGGTGVLSFNVDTILPITEKEVYLNILHKEYVMVYRYAGPIEQFGRCTSHLLQRAMIIESEFGTVFMIYRKDNNHVLKRNFFLYDDLIGTCYLSNSGQLVVACATPLDASLLEFDIRTSRAAGYLELEQNLLFSEPVMNNFLMSGMSDFLEFLDLIKKE